MVGGNVIGVTRLSDKTRLNVADCPHYPKHPRGDECPRPDTCCVCTDEIIEGTTQKIEIAIGDSVWWQSGRVYWTPRAKAGLDVAKFKDGKDYDIPLKKIGYSH